MGTLLRMRRTTCAHCKAKFTPEELAARQRIHQACITPFVQALADKKERARKKKEAAQKKLERAETRRRKEAIKTIPMLIKEAQIEFNKFIRTRDHDKPCICCGRPLGNFDVGGGFDCGHYRSTGSAPHLRFDERNAHAQRKDCNRWGAGRAVDYRIGLVARIGLEAVESLESENQVVKWDRETLKQIKLTYRAKLKALMKEEKDGQV